MVPFSFVVFAISLIFLAASRFRFFGTSPHPLAFPLLLYIFLLTLPATLLIGLMDYPLSYGTEQILSRETKDYAVATTFISVAILLFGVGFLFRTRVLTPVEYVSRPGRVGLMWWLTIWSYAILCLKLATLSKIPLVAALQGDFIGAAEAKIRILTNQDGVTWFGPNYVVRAFSSFVYLASLLFYIYDPKDKKKRAVFLANLPVALINALYDVQKVTPVLLVLITFWLAYGRNGRLDYLLRGLAIAVVIAGSMFVLTLGYGVDETLVGDAIDRVLVGQMEGMFYIYQILRPDEKYAWFGIPLANAFVIPQIDPAAEVVQALFPTAGDAWLNANTYYVAHAWTIFGPAGIVIGPIFVLVNVLLILRTAQPLIRRDPVIYYPLVVSIMTRLPVVNVFTEFMWMKVALDFFINLAFVFLLVRCYRVMALSKSTTVNAFPVG